MEEYETDADGYATVEALQAKRLDEDDVVVPGLGKFRVRGLSRGEILVAGEKQERQGAAAQERFMLARAILRPKVTEDIVGQWQTGGAAGETIPLQRRINELSKLSEGAAKSDVPSDGAGPQPGV